MEWIVRSRLLNFYGGLQRVRGIEITSSPSLKTISYECIVYYPHAECLHKNKCGHRDTLSMTPFNGRYFVLESIVHS
jgi:hypothetical protein